MSTLSAVSETIAGTALKVAAEVGLLTRNIKIIGDDYAKLQSQAFGARVLVGHYTNGMEEYTGLSVFHWFLLI